MRSMTRPLAGVALVTAFVVAGATEIDRDVVDAQTHKAITVTRIYTGTDGQSHAQEIEMMLTSGTATQMIKATGVQFRRTPPRPTT